MNFFLAVSQCSYKVFIGDDLKNNSMFNLPINMKQTSWKKSKISRSQQLVLIEMGLFPRVTLIGTLLSVTCTDATWSKLDHMK